MKIVNLNELKQMPKGTVFAMYEPCIITSDLMMKETDDAKWNDEIELLDVGDVFCEVDTRSFQYDEGQKFIVLSQSDIEQMMCFLKEARGYDDSHCSRQRSI
jgi:hypothetical protein